MVPLIRVAAHVPLRRADDVFHNVTGGLVILQSDISRTHVIATSVAITCCSHRAGREGLSLTTSCCDER